MVHKLFKREDASLGDNSDQRGWGLFLIRLNHSEKCPSLKYEVNIRYGNRVRRWILV